MSDFGNADSRFTSDARAVYLTQDSVRASRDVSGTAMTHEGLASVTGRPCCRLTTPVTCAPHRKPPAGRDL